MMSTKKPEHAAVVLGMFETGLAVVRGLGRAKIRVLGLDHRFGTGFRSKYVKASVCPEPLSNPDGFVDYLMRLAESEEHKPVLFVTSDDFLLAVSRNRERLQESLLLNVPDADTLESIADKYRQYELARSAGVPVPATVVLEKPADLEKVRQQVPFPVFVKAREVTSWRNEMGGALKGFVANTPEELAIQVNGLLARGLAVLVQELIPGTRYQPLQGLLLRLDARRGRAFFCASKASTAAARLRLWLPCRKCVRSGRSELGQALSRVDRLPGHRLGGVQT